jgi:hypothetical protein
MAVGLVFVKVASSHQPDAKYTYILLVAVTNAMSPTAMPVAEINSLILAYTVGPMSAAAAVTKTVLSVVAVMALLLLLDSVGVRVKVVPEAVYTPLPSSHALLGPSIV